MHWTAVEQGYFETLCLIHLLAEKSFRWDPIHLKDANLFLVFSFWVCLKNWVRTYNTQNCRYTDYGIHSLLIYSTSVVWMPNEAFFHWNSELLGLGRQIGQINSGAFGVFSAELLSPILVQRVPCSCFPLSNHYFYKKLYTYSHPQSMNSVRNLYRVRI